MNLVELRAMNLSRCNRWHPSAGVNEWSNSDWGVAAAGELGEALNVIKKINRYNHGFTGNKETIDELLDMLAEELADTILYIDLLAERNYIDLSEAIRKKFNRVSLENNFPERL